MGSNHAKSIGARRNMGTRRSIGRIPIASRGWSDVTGVMVAIIMPFMMMDKAEI